jgi:dienelactone hydrolase
MHRRPLTASGVLAGVLLGLTGDAGQCADNLRPEASHAELAEALEDLDGAVLSADRDDLAAMVRSQQRRRIQEANDRSREAWREIDDREEWERFRDPRLEALRRSLGSFPDPPEKLVVRVTGEMAGDGFRIENVVLESRPGVWVTANLYLPEPPVERPPGILICHSHHTPKEHGELQDMGMTWARAGCAVLVMDQWGHGERRQHLFRTADDYAGDFRVSRQDYYFRYDAAMQLHLAGESLVGWMAWDLMRGVDLLLARPGADPERIILLGAVAGGGDPAAIAAAIDPRITAAVPFNFGGPQPETRYPLPDDAETSFNYAGGGSWESTRNLRNSAADGFLPWVIVGGIAPRRLVYGHEFRWDRPRDPVWRRLQTIYGDYDQPDRLAFTHGRGELRGRPPEATHCTHIEREHRVMIHAALEKWFGIAVSPEDEYTSRVDASRLRAMTRAAERELHPQSLCDVLADLAGERLTAVRQTRETLLPEARRQDLREAWRRVLGDIDGDAPPRVTMEGEPRSLSSGATVRRIALETEPGITVPLLLLIPPRQERPAAAVVAVAQGGKAGFLRERAEEIARILEGGVAVCLPDLRGTGETQAGDDRGRTGAETAISATEQMLGGTMVGARLRDLRAVLTYLRGRDDLDGGRIALWGDSFAALNPPDVDVRIPHGVSPRPRQSEPLGGMLALLGALFDEEIAAVHVHGGLAGFEPVLSSPFVLIPHDAAVPGLLTAGDMADAAAALAPRPLRISGV